MSRPARVRRPAGRPASSIKLARDSRVPFAALMNLKKIVRADKRRARALGGACATRALGRLRPLAHQSHLTRIQRANTLRDNIFFLALAVRTRTRAFVANYLMESIFRPDAATPARNSRWPAEPREGHDQEGESESDSEGEGEGDSEDGEGDDEEEEAPAAAVSLRPAKLSTSRD